MNAYTNSPCSKNLQNSLYKGLINKEIGSTISNSIAATNQSRFISKKASTLLLSLICVLTLAACGGGGGGGNPPPVDDSISVSNLRVIPAADSATLTWDNPNAAIQHINISYKASTTDIFREMIITDNGKRARSEVNRSEVLPISPTLTAAVGFTFNVRLKLAGADVNKTVSTKSISWLIGPNLDGDKYADAHPDELDKDGDNVNDVQDAFPDDRALSAFAVTDFPPTPGNEEVTLIWTNPVANISMIRIRYYNTDTPDTLQSHPLITDTLQTAPGAQNVRETITGLTNGQSYTFTVSLTLDRDDVDKRVSATSTTATPNFFAVVGLDARPGDSNVTLSWTNPDTDNIVSINISYHNRKTPDALQYFPLITDTTKRVRNMEVEQSITSLTNGEYYTFIVALTLTDGEEGASRMIEVAIGPNLDGDGVADFVDVDADGDGLIEIATADELNQTRNNLQGTSFKETADAVGDAAGCGGQNAGISECNGYELVANISLAGYNGDNWQPIGSCPSYDIGTAVCTNKTALFNSTFDGNGYIISNLTIINPTGDYANAAGLFGAIAEKVQLRNIHIRSANITGAGNSNVGMLVGYANGASIINSSAEGTVMITLVSASQEFNVGGLVGSGVGVTITSSYAAGGTIAGNVNVGGLVGDGVGATITSSYAAVGAVSGYINTGGLVGNGESATITSSYASGGSVTAIAQDVGGLVGGGTDVIINSSYAAVGAVTISAGSAIPGGLVGKGEDAAITDSYWDSMTTGRADDGNPATGVGKTTDELQDPTDFTSGIYVSWANQWCDPATGKFTDDRTSDIALRLGGEPFDMATLNKFRVWDLGDADQYPALTCVAGGLATQRP